jgi:PII-like signaling protein
MISTYENYITLLSVYIYTKEKSDNFEDALYTPTNELKKDIKKLMCVIPMLQDILDKEHKIENSFRYLINYIHTKKFSEERFYLESKATFIITDEEQENIIQGIISISNENSKLSIQEKDVGRHIAHHLFDKKEYFQQLIKKQDIINNLLDFTQYNKKTYYQLFSLASIYIILKDYYPEYEKIILKPNEPLYDRLEELYIEVPVLKPIIDKNIVIRDSIIVLQECIDNNQMIESKFFNFMKSLKENLETFDKEVFLKDILQILSMDGVISQKEEIFFKKLSDILNFDKLTSEKLMKNYEIKKIYKIKWKN